MSAPFRELENRVRGFPPLVRELVLRYVEENPEAANDPHLVMHALILPLCRGSKDKQDVWDERLGWAFFERLLQAGADRAGAYLSPAECKLLLQVIRGERKPIRGKRQHAGTARWRITSNCSKLMEDGSPKLRLQRPRKFTV